MSESTTPRSPRTEAGTQLARQSMSKPVTIDQILAIEDEATALTLLEVGTGAEAAAPRSGEVEKAARAWVAEHRNGRTCTIVDCPTATALRAAVDATEVST